MARRPTWWHTLQEGRRQALVAIDFYNKTGDDRSFLDFVVHMHLAWQNLLHAHLQHHQVNIFFRQKNGHYKRDKHGEKQSWDLSTCIQRVYKDKDPLRANLEFFIGLRNKIEHRFERSLLSATSGHAHALVINFEAELVRLFGADESLAPELRFPLFVQSLTPAGMQHQRELRRGLPIGLNSYITEFESRITPELAEDPRFDYRVQLIPIKGSKTEADMAFNFVNIKALTPDQVRDLSAGQAGTVLVVEKQKPVGLLEELLPKAIVQEIAERIPFKISMSDFTKVRWKHKVGPAQGEHDDASDGAFCIYSKPHGNHLYTRAYVDRCAGELSTREGWIRLLGKEPTAKE